MAKRKIKQFQDFMDKWGLSYNPSVIDRVLTRNPNSLRDTMDDMMVRSRDKDHMESLTNYLNPKEMWSRGNRLVNTGQSFTGALRYLDSKSNLIDERRDIMALGAKMTQDAHNVLTGKTRGNFSAIMESVDWVTKEYANIETAIHVQNRTGGTSLDRMSSVIKIQKEAQLFKRATGGATPEDYAGGSSFQSLAAYQKYTGAKGWMEGRRSQILSKFASSDFDATGKDFAKAESLQKEYKDLGDQLKVVNEQLERFGKDLDKTRQGLMKIGGAVAAGGTEVTEWGSRYRTNYLTAQSSLASVYTRTFDDLMGGVPAHNYASVARASFLNRALKSGEQARTAERWGGSINAIGGAASQLASDFINQDTLAWGTTTMVGSTLTPAGAAAAVATEGGSLIPAFGVGMVSMGITNLARSYREGQYNWDILSQHGAVKRINAEQTNFEKINQITWKERQALIDVTMGTYDTARSAGYGAFANQGIFDQPVLSGNRSVFDQVSYSLQRQPAYMWAAKKYALTPNESAAAGPEVGAATGGMTTGNAAIAFAGSLKFTGLSVGALSPDMTRLAMMTGSSSADSIRHLIGGYASPNVFMSSQMTSLAMKASANGMGMGWDVGDESMRMVRNVVSGNTPFEYTRANAALNFFAARTEAGKSGRDLPQVLSQIGNYNNAGFLGSAVLQGMGMADLKTLAAMKDPGPAKAAMRDPNSIYNQYWGGLGFSPGQIAGAASNARAGQLMTLGDLIFGTSDIVRRYAADKGSVTKGEINQANQVRAIQNFGRLEEQRDMAMGDKPLGKAIAELPGLMKEAYRAEAEYMAKIIENAISKLAEGGMNHQDMVKNIYTEMIRQLTESNFPKFLEESAQKAGMGGEITITGPGTHITVYGDVTQ